MRPSGKTRSPRAAAAVAVAAVTMVAGALVAVVLPTAAHAAPGPGWPGL